MDKFIKTQINKIKEFANKLVSKRNPDKQYIKLTNECSRGGCLICNGSIDAVFKNKIYYNYETIDSDGSNRGNVYFYIHACSYECFIEYVKFQAKVYESLEKIYREKLN